MGEDSGEQEIDVAPTASEYRSSSTYGAELVLIREPQNTQPLELRFRATLGEEPEVEVGLV
jgi:hypothetical protein